MNVALLILALNSLHVHGSKAKCEELAKALVRVAVTDAKQANAEIHFDEDLTLIKTFKESCKRRSK